jgi:ribosome modulation factor
LTAPRRKEEIKRVTEEGREAARKERHRQTCPYKHMNRMHWMLGYDEVQERLNFESDYESYNSQH